MQIEESIEVSSSGTLVNAVDNLVVAYSFARRGYVWDFIEEYIQRPIATLIDMFGTDDLEYDTVKERRERYVTQHIQVPDSAAFVGAVAAIAAATTAMSGAGAATATPIGAALVSTGTERDITEGTPPEYEFPGPVAPLITRGIVDIITPDAFKQQIQIPGRRTRRVKRVWYEDVFKAVKGTEGFHSMACGDRENLEGLTPPRVRRVLGFDKDSEIAGKLDTRKRKRAAVVSYVDKLMRGAAIGG